MLKALMGSGLTGVVYRRIQLLSLLRSSSGVSYNGRRRHEKSLEEEEAIPLQCLFSRFYSSDGRRHNKKGGDGNGVRPKRIAAEVKEVISEAFQRGPCHNPLLHRCGFEIQNVKMSSDLRTAHVMWTALPGMQQSAERAAISKVRRLRSLVFERLNLPFSPTIKFQEDKPSEQMVALDEVFAKLKESEIQDQRQNESELQSQSESEMQSQGESELQTADDSELQKENSFPTAS